MECTVKIQPVSINEQEMYHFHSECCIWRFLVLTGISKFSAASLGRKKKNENNLILTTLICNFTLSKFCADNHRIIKLEKILKIIKSNHPHKLLNPSSLNHVLSITTTSLKYLQGWWLHQSPGQSVPMPNNPFCEEILSDIQSKPTLTKLEAVSFVPYHLYIGSWDIL